MVIVKNDFSFKPEISLTSQEMAKEIRSRNPILCESKS